MQNLRAITIEWKSLATWVAGWLLVLPRLRARAGCILCLSLLGSMQAYASQPTGSEQYKSVSTDLAEAFQVGAAFEFEGEDDIGLVGRYHFATHTRDFDKARAPFTGNWDLPKASAGFH